jgi:hypothetical protein
MSRGETSNLGAVPISRLLSMARRVKAKREKAIAESGQVIAELRQRGLSWRVIGAEVGVPPDTARYWAKPYLKSGEDTAD